VLLKALEKSPKDRYQSGKSLMGALRKALLASPSKTQTDPALPPIPANAPTIQRSDVSLKSFTKRGDVITALDKRMSTHHAIDEELPPIKTSKRRYGWLALVLLLLLAFGGFMMFRPGLIGQWFVLPASPTAPAPLTEPAIQVPATDTLTPLPVLMETSLTSTQTPTKTLAPTVTNTASQQPTKTSVILSSTPAIMPTVVTSTITQTPTGYFMTAFYNSNSFYILNRGRASRSASGFMFERIDENGVIQQRFEGWKWEKYFDTIQPNRCLSLEIHASPDPYLKPFECNNKILSPLVLLMDSGEIFWTSNEPNGLFRILWLGNEIARCEIEAGICDFYVP
jgi:hypothetical protein